MVTDMQDRTFVQGIGDNFTRLAGDYLNYRVQLDMMERTGRAQDALNQTPERRTQVGQQPMTMAERDAFANQTAASESNMLTAVGALGLVGLLVLL